jgi:hypothetical protein
LETSLGNSDTLSEKKRKRKKEKQEKKKRPGVDGVCP